jgi:hypothetical protein
VLATVQGLRVLGKAGAEPAALKRIGRTALELIK